MTPYELAWHGYHRYGEPGWSWEEVVGLHFRHGVVVSLPDAFILARRVWVNDSDEVHASPLEWAADGDCWMVWAAAGRLQSLAVMVDAYPSGWLSFQRRDCERIRRIRTSDFLRHVSQSAEAPATPSPADLQHGTGTGGGESGGKAPDGEKILV